MSRAWRRSSRAIRTRILSVVCTSLWLVAALLVVSGAAEGRSAPAALAVGPSVVSSNYVLESCANDHALPGGGCDEISESNLSGFIGSTTATEGSKHGAAGLQVSIESIPTGLVIHAAGSGGISSSVGAGTGTADTHAEFTADVAVGDEPIAVAVSGTIDLSGAPCTSGPAVVGVSFGDGSSTVAECPGVGQSVSASYVASPSSTVSFSASGDVALFDEAETASFSFDITFVLGCTHAGTPGNDTILGTSGDDVMCGFAGDDTLRGLGGNDYLIGAAGDDVLLGGADNDNLDAGPGAEADLLFGGPGDDLLFEGSFMFGGSGNDTLLGGARSAFMFGCGGVDGIFGEGGDDVIAPYQAPTVSDQDVLDALGITGQASEVACKSSPQPDGKDTITGDGGHDVISGGDGNDKINGGAQVDIIRGDADRDTITGAAGKDKLFGGGGNDKIFAKDGKPDVVRGGGGFDRAKRDKGSDDISGVEAFI